MPRFVPPSTALPRWALMVALAALVGLSACAPQVAAPTRFGTAPALGGPPQSQATRAALLVPLTGPQAPLGAALLNASTMALFDEASRGVELLPRDTGGTPSGAAAAARAAIAEGARVIVGPLTSAEAGAVAPIARAGGVPMLAFTNDAQRAGDGAWVLGITPEQQVRRVVSAAAQDGAQRFVLAAPNNEFGRQMAVAVRGAASDLRLPQPAVSLHPSGAEPAMAARAARAASPQADAVLIGEGGDRARRFAAAFLVESAAAPSADATQAPRMLGTALWINDPGLRGDSALNGAWFPGPDSSARARFEDRYREAFGETPPRIAAAAYDASAIAARALRSGIPVAVITTRQSFSGADGPVRLLDGGRTVRGLAIYALSPSGEPALVDPAPDPAGFGF